MLRQFSAKRIAGFFLLDWIGTISALYIAAYLRAELGRLPAPIEAFMRSLQIQTNNFWKDPSPFEILPYPVFILVAILWPFFLITFAVYDGRKMPTYTSELLYVFLGVSVSTLTLAGLLYFTYRETPRVLILIFFILDTSLLVGARTIWITFRYLLKGDVHIHRRQVLIIGAGPVGQSAAEKLTRLAWQDVQICGYLDDDDMKVGSTYHGYQVLGTLDETNSIVQKYRIQEAIVALPLHAHERLIDICSELQRQAIRVNVIPDLFSLTFPSASLDNFAGMPVIDLGEPGLLSWQRQIKRAFDIIASTISLILLSPLLALAALLIKLDSPGAVIHKQWRIGENGQKFLMYKFRTMYNDADKMLLEALDNNPKLKSEWEHYQKLKKDPRITRVGKVLRQFSLDEFPQLWNVLKGEMSIIGPRPFFSNQMEEYGEAYHEYILVRPGMTGMWQVSGRNNTSFAERAMWDKYYVRNWSIGLEFYILLKTFWVVVKRDGAF